MKNINERMNQYEREKTVEEVNSREWEYAISTNMRDPTIAAIWMLHGDAMQCIKADYDPNTKYWLTVALSPDGKAHGHGVITCKALKKDINRCFRGANKPVMKPMYDQKRWIDYVAKQSLKNTITTNMNEVEQ